MYSYYPEGKENRSKKVTQPKNNKTSGGARAGEHDDNVSKVH